MSGRTRRCGDLWCGDYRARRWHGGSVLRRDAYAVSSGHDAWVLGDESVVTFEFDGTSGA